MILNIIQAYLWTLEYKPDLDLKRFNYFPIMFMNPGVSGSVPKH